jgi:hypothetical protein
MFNMKSSVAIVFFAVSPLCAIADPMEDFACNMVKIACTNYGQHSQACKQQRLTADISGYDCTRRDSSRGPERDDADDSDDDDARPTRRR